MNYNKQNCVRKKHLIHLLHPSHPLIAYHAIIHHVHSDSHHSLTLGEQDLRPRSGESDKIPTPPTGCLRGKPHRLPASSQQDRQSSKELLKLPDWLPAQQGAAENWKRKRMKQFPRALQRPHLPRKRKEMNLFPESISIGRFSFKE